MSSFLPKSLSNRLQQFVKQFGPLNQKRSKRKDLGFESLEQRIMLSSTSGADEHGHEALSPVYLPAMEFFSNPGGFLSGPSSADPLDIAIGYLRTHANDFGLTNQDLTQFIVSDMYVSSTTGITNIYLSQMYNGLEVLNADINISVMPDGRVLTAGSSFVGGLALNDFANPTAPQPTLTAAEALSIFGGNTGIDINDAPTVIEYLGGISQSTLLSAPDISLADVPARLVYLPTSTGVELAWNLNVQTVDGDHWYDASVSSTNGELVGIADWMSHASYNVYAANKESPYDGVRTVEVDPHLIAPNASPFGWHDTNGVVGAEFTDTRGNNVDAYTDRDFNNVPDPGSRPDGGAGLVFDNPVDLTKDPSTYSDAAVTNLFYWNNIIHDWHYQYGFDEASGNFQVNNYGNGGLGGDAVRAEAQDGSGTNNANFATPPDGSAPRMQMFEWTLTPTRRDGDFDNGIILHEYGHGVSNRLTGGPSNAGALQTIQSGGMGEGWSDIHALLFTQVAGDMANDARGIGTYALGQAPNGPGIRAFPYSYDMSVNPLTYGDVRTVSGVHAVGTVWATALWDLNWAFIDGNSLDPALPNPGLGFDADMFNGTGGNNLTMQLVMEGMKLQPANPSFLDARDAILAADQAITGGANYLTIWTVFARRGMGFSADDGGSSASQNVTEAFDIPLQSDGTVTFDQPEYFLGGVANIEVEDADLIGDGTLVVAVTSTNGDTESVTLTEVGNSGRFTGSIAIQAGVVAADGVINGAVGDTLTVTYNDADDGTGNPATVTDTADIVDTVSISGRVWRDQNLNSLQDAGEPGMPGVTVYLDLNDNGMLDGGEPTAISMTDDLGTPGVDETGNYEFLNLAAGTYVVREVVPVGFELTFPGDYNIVANGDFESGTFDGWALVTTTGGWKINNGTVDPDSGPSGPVVPLSGNLDAVNFQEGPGSQALVQTITVPRGINSATLSWLDRIFSFATISDPDQEFRVQLWDEADAVLATIFSTNPGDPDVQPGPNNRSFNVTSLMQGLEGQTVKLVFQSEPTQFHMNVWLDNIRLDLDIANDGFWVADVVDATTTSNLDFGNGALPTIDPMNVVTSLPEDTVTSPPVRVADLGIALNGSPFVARTLTGPDAALFIIVGDQLFLRDGVALDHETKPQLEVTVQIDDPARGTTPDDEATLIIDITDVNEAPVVTPATFTIPEHTANTTVLGTISSTDEDQPPQNLTYSITGGNTGNAFDIDPNTGELFVNDSAAVDFETIGVFNLTISVTDDGAPNRTGTAAVTVNLTDINDAPTVDDATFSLDEFSPIGTVVAALPISDVDAGAMLTYSILSGNTGGAFEIDSSGNLVVADSAPLVFVTNPVFTLVVEAVDNGSPALSGTGTITVNLNDVNDPPIVNADLFFIDEHGATGTAVGTATGSDADGTIDSWAIIGGNVGSAFTIDNSGNITVNNSSAVNYEVTPVFSLTVEATDNGGRTGTNTIVIVLNDILEQDLIIFDKRTRRWIFGDSDGAKFSQVTGAQWLLHEDLDTVEFVEGDFNGDGVGDVAGLTSSGVWLVGLINGTAVESGVWGLWPAGTTWNHVTTGDVNGDGNADIVGQAANGEWWVAISDGTSFETRALGTLPTLAWTQHLFGDFDGNNQLDLASFNEQGAWWVTANIGSSFTTSRWVRVADQATAGWMNFLVGDFNGDGKDDITAQQGTGQWWKFLGSTDHFVVEYGNRWATIFGDFHVADFNGDGRDDFAARTSGNSWWINEATLTGRFFARNAGGSWSTAETWTSVVGDFNGDGKADIAGVTASAGTWFVQLSDGALFKTRYFGQWLLNDTIFATDV
ncbi:MAG: M36 family metallopeptidase [Planctomycetaceae bacterium]